MKKLFLILAAVTLTAYVYGQDEKPDQINYGDRIGQGTVLLSGSFSYDKSFSDNETINLVVGGEFALSKRFALGLGFGYLSENYNYPQQSSHDKVKQFFVVPGFTLYGNISFGWLQPTISVAVPIGSGTQTLTNYMGEVIESKSNSVSAALSPGLNIYLSRKLALTASLGLINYTSIKYENVEEKDSSFGIGFTPSDLSFGLLFILGAK